MQINALKFCKIRKYKDLVQSDVEKELPFKKNAYDLVVVLDVLEHLNNDYKVLKKIYYIVKKGGNLS